MRVRQLIIQADTSNYLAVGGQDIISRIEERSSIPRLKIGLKQFNCSQELTSAQFPFKVCLILARE